MGGISQRPCGAIMYRIATKNNRIMEEKTNITAEQALEVLRREYPGRFIDVEEVYAKGNSVVNGGAFIVHHTDGYMQLVSAVTGEIIGYGLTCELRDGVNEPLTAKVEMHVRRGQEIKK